MAVTRNKIAKNLARINENIAAACKKVRRSPSEVCIIAVTKAVDVDTVKNLVAAGATHLGESRVKPLAERAEVVAEYLKRRRGNEPTPEIKWHMIGHLQRNKVKAALEYADVIHSVDSLRLAEEINSRAERLDRAVDVLLEVNCSQESQKFGCAVGAALHLGELICTLKHVRLVGLMTMAPLSKNPEAARPTFVRLSELFVEIKKEKIGGDDFKHLSMGMSQDYQVAVEEGATMLRIGTAIFE